MQTVLTCSKLISPQAMSQVIKFLYTGRIDSQIINIGALKQVTTAIFLSSQDINRSLCCRQPSIWSWQILTSTLEIS